MFVSYRILLSHSIKRVSGYIGRSTSSGQITKQVDACTGCEIPCTKHVPYPAEILAQIDRSTMENSVEKHRRHLCIGQAFLPSHWPKDVKDLEGNYLKELARVLNKKKDLIGYSIKLTSASTSSTNSSSSSHNADWYLFPDQLKIHNVPIEQIEEMIEKLFVQTTDEQRQIPSPLPKFSSEIHCERLTGLWILVCCHSQRDERCGKKKIRHRSNADEKSYFCRILIN